MTRLRSLAPVLALALLLVLPLALAAQAGDSGLPASSGPPRTLRAYTHVWVAFSVTWLLLFGYAVMLGRRFKDLEQQVVRLERA